MFITIKIFFILFFIYAFLGWCLEVSCKLLEMHKFINRGFLIGPYCPIYGYGAILITVLLSKFSNNFIILFFMAIILCGILEYLTSFFMEKLFHLRWWDYSQRKYNLKGRICINTIIPFGIMGIIIIYISNPFFFEKLYLLTNNQINIIFYILFIIFITDNAISIPIILGIGKTTKKINLENLQDNTEEITIKVKEILMQESLIQRRLINAYPKVIAIKIKLKEKIEETKDEIEKKKQELDTKIETARKEIKKKVRNDKINYIKRKRS